MWHSYQRLIMSRHFYYVLSRSWHWLTQGGTFLDSVRKLLICFFAMKDSFCWKTRFLFFKEVFIIRVTNQRWCFVKKLSGCCMVSFFSNSVRFNDLGETTPFEVTLLRNIMGNYIVYGFLCLLSFVGEHFCSQTSN